MASAPHIVHRQQTRLVVLHNGVLRDAVVVRWLGKERGNRHLLRFSSGEAGAVPLDLNEMNHSLQRFESAAAFEAERVRYLEHILHSDEFKYVEDAITGNRLEVASQLLNIGFREHERCDATDQTVDWRNVKTIQDLAKLLTIPSDQRDTGCHNEARPVLVAADPGTGKTWSMQVRITGCRFPYCLCSLMLPAC